MKIKDYGGPAFPTLHIPDASPPAWSGMTLRDYFAARAMQGFCAGLKEGDNIEALPALAYAMADAMLNAREEGGAE